MITVFLPCRAGSERVPKKNTKPFAGVEGGLLVIKLKELLKVNLVSKIVLSTNDPVVIDIAESLKSNNILIDKRPEALASSSTSTDDLIKYVPEVIKEGHIMWTHVTSPFLDSKVYTEIIEAYLNGLDNGNDSLMTVNKIQTFLWNEEGSLNYDRKIEKWPRTQTLPKLYEVNSGVFINSYENYVKYQDRIGEDPYLFETEGYASFDIDWIEDFNLGEFIYKSLNH
ncbi:acylneuraminate cytidylyltransferase family protein [Tamlana haliotis]|uniref:Acylneuraminate cytidylyltransferase family protein n=1 Tax=Pseudotamlana haliotis TaxID=2614804 RepID=A0A6N6M8Y3_9FLAO|nr:acylneuraminate cytidylyltransferase family protein [Tamlana haliotis]KAB1066518.1 acylneuraminate cytidylyltransferase family protein [Tamlana haliotis]